MPQETNNPLDHLEPGKKYSFQTSPSGRTLPCTVDEFRISRFADEDLISIDDGFGPDARRVWSKYEQDSGSENSPHLPGAPLTKPLTVAELESRSDEDGYVRELVSVKLELLVGGDLEDINNYVSEKITGSEAGLMSLTFKVAGSVTPDEEEGICTGSVLIEVFAQVDYDALDDEEDG